MKRALLLLVLLSFSALAEPLPRRLTGGVMLGEGMVVQAVTPGFPFAESGVKEGDVLVSIDGAAVTHPRELVAAIRSHKAGETMRVVVKRYGEMKTFDVKLREHPRITSDAYDVLYDETERFRLIVTKPRNVTRAPALYLVQGLGCFSVADPNDSYTRMLDAVTRAGFVTLRLDKPGTGDSEGGPCPEVDFLTEVRAYQAGLKWLVTQPYVDAKNISLFGHSMGGIMAPLIADAAPLKKAIVYGTGYNSWLYYMLENNRRQMRLGGTPFDVMAAEEKSFEKLHALLFIQKKSLGEALQEVPELRPHFPDGRSYAAGKPVLYFQQIYDTNLGKEWKEAKLPVTAIWGTSDFVASETDAEWLAAAVDSWLPGQGKLIRLANTDHWFNKAASSKQSMMQGPNGDFNEEVVTLLLEELRPTSS
jgi:uncharacterized protein